MRGLPLALLIPAARYACEVCSVVGAHQRLGIAGERDGALVARRFIFLPLMGAQHERDKQQAGQGQEFDLTRRARQPRQRSDRRRDHDQHRRGGGRLAQARGIEVLEVRQFVRADRGRLVFG